MTEFLLKLTGVQRGDAARVSGAEFVFRNSDWLPWAIAAALLMFAGVALSYWKDTRELVGPRKRAILIGARGLLIAVLLLLMLRPVVAFTLESSIRRGLLILLDTSGSMKIQDPRVDPSDLKRAAIARGILDARRGLEQTLDPETASSVKLMPRVDVLRGMLRNPRLNLLGTLEKELDLARFQFGDALSEVGEFTPPKISSAERESREHLLKTGVSWLDSLDPKAPATAIGDAVRDLIARKRGQALAGIFLVTDGASNLGSPPLEAAQRARQEGVPLFIYGVGITSPRDILVNSLLAQEVAFAKDELPVTVRVRAQGLRGENAKLDLTLTPVSGGEGETVATKELQFEGDEDFVVALPFTPKAQGEFVLTAKVDARPDEASAENNVLTQRLRVIESKVRVLYVETTPRWEFRYLQSVLARDRRLDAKFVLLEADPGLSEAPDGPYLPRIPATKDELFKHDLIIIGDVAAKDFTPEQLAGFEEFVQRFGGSMLFLAGPRHSPRFYGGTALERLLPVELDAAAGPETGPPGGIVTELTAQGRANPILKLQPDEDENARIWRGFGKIYWAARVLRAKPAAQVLLVDADETKANRHGKLVLSAMHQYGLGQVLYFGTDNTWRWRRNSGDRSYALLWGQIAQKLGLRHLLGGSKRTQLSVDKQSYTTGERVAVYARLFGSDYSPVRDATVAAGYAIKVNGAPGPRQDVLLRALPDQSGMYRGEFVALAPGTHQFSVKSDPATTLEFDVAEPRFESGETAMNETLLRQMAEASGGAYFREESLWQLPAAIASKAERVTSSIDGELWSSPLAFVLVLLVATVEWWLRKRWQLK
jgi:hypothetical protein